MMISQITSAAVWARRASRLAAARTSVRRFRDQRILAQRRASRLRQNPRAPRDVFHRRAHFLSLGADWTVLSDYPVFIWNVKCVIESSDQTGARGYVTKHVWFVADAKNGRPWGARGRAEAFLAAPTVDHPRPFAALHDLPNI
jgi:hypothetical protein